jgi:cysteine desulfurase
MIYLDHHAATPICEPALLAMNAGSSAAWANPSSAHTAGRGARALLERARAQIADAIGAQAADVVLTSGGSEACNLGVLGVQGLAGGQHVVTTEIEHPAVAQALRRLETDAGIAVSRLAVPAGAPPSAEQLAAALRPETRLCALQWINHETGAILPVADYGQVCRAAGVVFFVDATQAAGKLPIDVATLGADLVALASHKLGGPAGAGALWVRRGLQLSPVITGGSQERGRRAGSPDVLHAVGFGAACAQLRERLAAQPRLQSLRAHTAAELQRLGGVLNGDLGNTIATVVNASFAGRRGDELVAALDLEGVCVASGAACSSGLSEPSPVLLAMYPSERWRASSALRLSFGPETTETEVESALEALARVLSRRAA